MKTPTIHASALGLASLGAALLLASVVTLHAAPGDLDTTWNANASAQVSTVAIQADGKILAGGTFTTIGGQTRAGVARLTTTNGGADTSFNASGSGLIRAVMTMPDGKVWVGGAYASIGGLSRNNFARLNADGTADASLTTDANERVDCLRLQTNGKILVGGNFGMSSFVGMGGNGGLRRLNAEGTPDTGFLNATNSSIISLAALPNGKVMVGGGFTTIGGPVWRFLAQCNGNTGAVEGPNFSIGNPAFFVGSIVPQADGKILVAGNFPNIRGVTISHVARLNADLTVDTSFASPNINGSVLDMVLQTDGKIIVCGDFTQAGGFFRTKIARLNADGTLDTTFDAGLTSSGARGTSLALAADGRIIVAGDFTSVNFTTRNRIARLLNDPATQSLTTTPSRIEWLRGGSSPEAEWVTFDQSTDSGATWTPLGFATRISGGWELIGLSLPGGAQIRARARVKYSLIDQPGATITPMPEIAVEEPTGTDLSDGSASVGFSNVFTGSTQTKTFTIRNTGLIALSVTGISTSGGDSGVFTVSAPAMPLSVAADSSATFTVSFSPVLNGARSTTLQILSDDADEATFDIGLTGTGDLAPAIVVEHPVGTNVPHLSTIPFGNVTLGNNSAAKTFTLKNTGLGSLNVTSISMKFGSNADFILSTPTLPFSVPAADSVTFTTTFSPTAIGARSAYISIESNDADEPVFYIQTTGTGLEVVDSAPVITSPRTSNAFVPFFYNYQMTATDIPNTFTASGLPAGLSLNAATGVISGTPSTTGVFNIQLSAANAGFGAGPAVTLVLTITNPNLPFLNAIELPPTTPISLSGPWVVQTAVTHDGVDALRCSPGWFNFGRLTLPIQGPATFSCWWKADSGDAFNTAWIRLDGFAVTIANISAENSGWQRVEYAIPAGAHTVEITMDRFSDSFGSAATIWLDEVSIVSNSPDADGDGMPDTWEITHFGSAGATSGAADADSDGLNNFGEYAFGLNPHSGDLTGLPQPALVDGKLTLTVTKQPYVTYAVVSSADLAAGGFNTLGLTIVTDTATTLTVQETTPDVRRFMKINAVPQP